jgi:hypothetical protein
MENAKIIWREQINYRKTSDTKTKFLYRFDESNNDTLFDR